MTNPDRTPAEIADALEALAVENDEVDAIVSGGEHRAPLLRAAAARLRAMDAALEPLAVFSEKLHASLSDDDHINGEFINTPGEVRSGVLGLRVGDLRRARTARGES